VDAVVRSAGFERTRLSRPPFYFQNLKLFRTAAPAGRSSRLGGSRWIPHARHPRRGHQRARPSRGCAFGAGAGLANGSYFAVCGGTYSWDDS